ncbi:ATP citrate lyase subunit 1 [Balamuthia mandrillaris]
MWRALAVGRGGAQLPRSGAVAASHERASSRLLFTAVNGRGLSSTTPAAAATAAAAPSNRTSSSPATESVLRRTRRQGELPQYFKLAGVPFSSERVKRIKEEKSEEQLALFLRTFERPFLQRYKQVYEEAVRARLEERRGRRKERRLERLTNPPVPTPFRLNQERLRRWWHEHVQSKKVYPLLPKVLEAQEQDIATPIKELLQELQQELDMLEDLPDDDYFKRKIFAINKRFEQEDKHLSGEAPMQESRFNLSLMPYATGFTDFYNPEDWEGGMSLYQRIDEMDPLEHWIHNFDTDMDAEDSLPPEQRSLLRSLRQQHPALAEMYARDYQEALGLYQKEKQKSRRIRHLKLQLARHGFDVPDWDGKDVNATKASRSSLEIGYLEEGGPLEDGQRTLGERKQEHALLSDLISKVTDKSNESSAAVSDGDMNLDSLISDLRNIPKESARSDIFPFTQATPKEIENAEDDEELLEEDELESNVEDFEGLEVDEVEEADEEELDVITKKDIARMFRRKQRAETRAKKDALVQKKASEESAREMFDAYDEEGGLDADAPTDDSGFGNEFGEQDYYLDEDEDYGTVPFDEFEEDEEEEEEEDEDSFSPADFDDEAEDDDEDHDDHDSTSQGEDSDTVAAFEQSHHYRLAMMGSYKAETYSGQVFQQREDVYPFVITKFYSNSADVAVGSLGRRNFLERKIRLKVLVPLLGLKPAVEQRLVSLVGPRYDPSTGILTIVADRQPTKEQNAQHAKMIFRELLKEAFMADPQFVPLDDLHTPTRNLISAPMLPPEEEYEYDHVLMEQPIDTEGLTLKEIEQLELARKKKWKYHMFRLTSLMKFPTVQDSARRTAEAQQRLQRILSSQ